MAGATGIESYLRWAILPLASVDVEMKAASFPDLKGKLSDPSSRRARSGGLEDLSMLPALFSITV